MSSSFQCSVLCPSGHTVSFKGGPNDPVLKILLSACEKRHLDPDTHKLKHYRNFVDTSLSIRFANLPNQAKLELVEKTPEEIKAQSNKEEAKVH